MRLKWYNGIYIKAESWVKSVQNKTLGGLEGQKLYSFTKKTEKILIFVDKTAQNVESHAMYK